MLPDTTQSENIQQRNETDTLLPDLATEDAAVVALHAGEGAPDGLRGWFVRLRGQLLSLPLFYKVLIANSAIVLLGALAGTAITWHVARANSGQLVSWPLQIGWPLALGFALTGLALTLLLNAVILRAAFSPLAQLQDVVRRVRRGDHAVRMELTPLADAGLTRIGETLNDMLDEVQGYEEQVRNLSGALISAQEGERQRIARELHDDTGQVLTLLLIRLKLLEAQPGAEELRPQIEELRGLVSSAIDQVRRLALNLRPPTIDQLGLVPALRSLTTNFSENAHIPVALDLPREQISLSPERTIAVYRVVQEALTNAAKHAGARNVSVSGRMEDGALRVDIRDDGKGFAPESYLVHARGKTSGAGVGLFGMEERARLAGGTLRVQSAPGRGTAVTLRVPVDEQEVRRDSK